MDTTTLRCAPTASCLTAQRLTFLMQIYKHHTAAGHTVEKVCSCLPPVVGAPLLTINCRQRLNWPAMVRKRILLGDECIMYNSAQ